MWFCNGLFRVCPDFTGKGSSNPVTLREYRWFKKWTEGWCLVSPESDGCSFLWLQHFHVHKELQIPVFISFPCSLTWRRSDAVSGLDQCYRVSRTSVCKNSQDCGFSREHSTAEHSLQIFACFCISWVHELMTAKQSITAGASS